MPRENVEIVRELWEAVNRRDVESFITHLDPDFEFRSPIIGRAEGTVHRGHDGARGWIASSTESFEEISFEATDFRDLGDRVLALGLTRARGRGSGLELDSPTGWLCTVRDGKVVKIDGFLSRAEALKAAGLSE
jgi:ketosteroid isomerase-like protein